MSLTAFGRSDPRWLILILVLSALGAAVLGLVAWFLLPLVPFGGSYPFAGAAPRLGVVLAITVAWGVLNALLRAKRNTDDQARLDALDKQETAAQVQQDAVDLARKAAFARLRRDARRALRRRPMADLRPRYLVVGPPASGKSTALAAADLNLPYAAPRVDAAEPDPGCRFLPSDEAVFVDVAGDLMLGGRPEWVGLWPRVLALIRSRRPTRPVDGIILVVAATDLADPAEEASTDLARALRTRLDEIAHYLRVSVPVYLLLSKVDRVPGFAEFFEPLGVEERAQIWGVALPGPDKPAPGGAPRADFGDVFDELVWRAVARQLNFLHTEPDPVRRTLAYEFPSQLASLRGCIATFLTNIARHNQSDGAPRLRGVFLASAGQDGAIVDVIGAAMSKTFALPALPGGPSRALRVQAHPRAYFLKQLLGTLIPAEAGLGQVTKRARLAARTRLYGLRIATVAMASLAAFLMWGAYREADAYIARVVSQAGDTQADAEQWVKAARPQAEPADFPLMLAVLDGLARLKAAADTPAPEAFVNAAEVRSTASGSYGEGLRTLLVPLVVRSLEARLAQAELSPAIRFECLKLYLLLGEGRSIPVALLSDLGPMLAGDWLGLGADAELLGRTVDQIEALADVSLPPGPMNGTLVVRTRRTLTGMTAAQIGYEMLRQQPSIRALKPWRPIDHAGGLGPRVIARASGVPLSEGIDGLFTADGVQEVVPAAASLAEALAGDAWVFGPEGSGQLNLAARAIQSGIIDLYRADYVRAWEALLMDLTVPPMATSAAAADVFTILFGQNSPVQQLLTAVVAETSPDQQVGDALTQVAGQSFDASPAASVAASPIAAAILPKGSRAALTTGPRQVIARQFASLRAAVVRPKDGQDSKVETALKSLDPLYRQLLVVASGGPQPDPPAAGTTAGLVQVALNQLPLSIRPYFTRLDAEGKLLVRFDVRGRAAQAWSTTVRPVCQSVVTRTFPFDPKAIREVALADFTQLFAPNGLIASFRRNQMANLVDTGARPWRWRDGRPQPSDRPDPTLAMFERADAITAAFFAEGDQPHVRFTMEALRLDPRAESMQLDVGGESLRYAHGPQVPFAGQWPPVVADAPATLSLRPEVDGKPNSLVGEGRWGLFRLIAQGRPFPFKDGQLLTFDVGGRRTQVKVAAATLSDPFDLRQLVAFTCPEF